MCIKYSNIFFPSITESVGVFTGEKWIQSQVVQFDKCNKMAGVLFEDIFDVKDIDPEGKKFDRGK